MWTLVFVSMLMMPGVLFGLGVGTLERNSGLNETFDGKIALLSSDPDELETLKINLADEEEFARAGIQRVPALSSLRFKVVETGAGNDYISITSSAPIREPFLNFLIEVNWARGRIVREYTVLLDPPLYDPSQRVALQAAISEAGEESYAPSSSPSAESYDATPDDYRADDPGADDYGANDTGASDVYNEPENESVSDSTTTSEPIARSGGFIPGIDRPTERGDTLWSIAQLARPDSGVSMEQMMLAMLRANPEAFIQDNINTLNRGYVLRVPDRDEIEALAQSSAVEEVTEQHALWEQYRGTRAATTTPEPIGLPEVEPEFELDTEPETELDEEIVDESFREEARLKLVSPTEDVVGADESATASDIAGQEMRRDLTLANERQVAVDQENAALRDQLTESEALVSDLGRMIELREAELAAMQGVLADSPEETYDATVAEDEGAHEGEVGEGSEDEYAGEEIGGGDSVGDVAEQTEADVDDGLADDGEAVDSEAIDSEQIVLPPSSEQGLVAKLNNMLGGIIPDSILSKIPGGVMTILAIPLLFIVGLVLMVVKMLRGGSGEDVGSVDGGSFDFSSEDATDTSSAIDFDHESETELPEEADPTAVPGDLASTQTLDLGDAGIGEIDGLGDGAGTDDVDEDEDAKTQFLAPEAASTDDTPDLGDTAPEVPAMEPEEDPLAEVNVYLAYERFDQAEELVRNAIAEEPGNHGFKLRLLEVFYSSNNKNAYEETARELNDAIGGEGDLWNSAVAMWQEMSPDRALFEAGADIEEAPADASAAREFVDITANEDGEAERGGLDSDLSDGIPADADGVLDLTGGEAADSTFDPQATVQGESVLDITSGGSDDVFDLTAAENGAGAPADAPEDLLDVTATGDMSEIESDDLLNVTASGGLATPEETVDDEEDFDGGTVLDITAGEQRDEEDNVLEFYISGGEDAGSVDSTVEEIIETGEGPDDAADNILEFDANATIEAAAADQTVVSDLINDAGDEDDATELFLDTVAVSLDDLSLDIEGAEESTGPDLTLDAQGDDDGGLELISDDNGDGSLEIQLEDDDSNDFSLDLDLDIGDEGGKGEGTDTIGTIDLEQFDASNHLQTVKMEQEPSEEGLNEETLAMPRATGVEEQTDADEVDTKLNLAKAYIELGDKQGAQTILDEVANGGTDAQQQEAAELRSQLD